MTERKVTLRQRRRATIEDLPIALADWFAGESSETPWEALLPSDVALLPERWKIWTEEHPKARPPAGFEWIAKRVRRDA